MHEISIAQNILKTVKKYIISKNILSVNKIVVSLGVLSGVQKDSLVYSFGLIPKDKLFANTELVVHENSLVVYCTHCDKETSIIDSYILKCSTCGNLTKNIVKGKELTIDTIEY